MTEEEQARLLAEWLDAPAGTPPPEGIDADALETAYMLRPDLAPPLRDLADDILNDVREGPMSHPPLHDDAVEEILQEVRTGPLAANNNRGFRRWLPIASLLAAAAVALITVGSPPPADLATNEAEEEKAPSPMMRKAEPPRPIDREKREPAPRNMKASVNPHARSQPDPRAKREAAPPPTAKRSAPAAPPAPPPAAAPPAAAEELVAADEQAPMDVIPEVEDAEMGELEVADMAAAQGASMGSAAAGRGSASRKAAPLAEEDAGSNPWERAQKLAATDPVAAAEILLNDVPQSPENARIEAEARAISWLISAGELDRATELCEQPRPTKGRAAAKRMRACSKLPDAP